MRGGSGEWRKSLSPIIGMSVNLVILRLVQLLRARLVKRAEFATVGFESACDVYSRPKCQKTCSACWPLAQRPLFSYYA